MNQMRGVNTRLEVKNNFDDKRYAVKTFRVFSNKTHLKILQLFSPRRLCSQFGAVIRSSK